MPVHHARCPYGVGRIGPVSVFLCLALTCSAPLVAAEDGPAVWPQWRGPTRDGQIAALPAWPDGLQGDRLTPLWRVELGPGYPGPIVTDDRVFVAETVDETDEVVRALDRRTGAELWRASWAGSLSVPFFAKSNGDWIRSTPAYDAETDTLFVAGMRDVLVALDGATGTERWRVDFVERFEAPLPAFGCCSSPLVIGDHVYIQAGAGFVKLDKRTGATVWRVLPDDGGMMGSAFASPVLATLAGHSQLLVQGREKLAGVDPASGDVLWSQPVEAFRGMNILTPTTFADGILTSTYGGKTLLYRPRPEGDQWQVETAWTEKSQGYMSSPVIIDGKAYLHLRNQRFVCIDLATGERLWASNPYGAYASLVAQGDRILALDSGGELLLIRANPAEFELLDSRQISEQPTWGHLAVCGDELFIRELKAIAVYRWRESGPPE
jgi:outer membrane protein assembly factor BamB